MVPSLHDRLAGCTTWSTSIRPSSTSTRQHQSKGVSSRQRLVAPETMWPTPGALLGPGDSAGFVALSCHAASWDRAEMSGDAERTYDDFRRQSSSTRSPCLAARRSASVMMSSLSPGDSRPSRDIDILLDWERRYRPTLWDLASCSQYQDRPGAR